jgi:hypothetical protein
VPGALNAEDAAAFRAIANATASSWTRTKHGLQPYGCGSVLFRDPSVGRFYKHDSPYTYFTSDDIAPGRNQPGMLARGRGGGGALGDLAMLPLKGGKRPGRGLAESAAGGAALGGVDQGFGAIAAVHEPSLDIINFFPLAKGWRVSAINALVERTFSALMNDAAHPIYLAKLNLKPRLVVQHPELIWDAPALTVLRSVLMKPEHLAYVPGVTRTGAGGAANWFVIAALAGNLHP